LENGNTALQLAIRLETEVRELKKRADEDRGMLAAKLAENKLEHEKISLKIDRVLSTMVSLLIAIVVAVVSFWINHAVADGIKIP
jgi:hypothetical protein